MRVRDFNAGRPIIVGNFLGGFARTQVSFVHSVRVGEGKALHRIIFDR